MSGGPRGAAPAVVVAAPASGTGKTTIATGLMAALRATGRVIAPFKVGPDYIDPGYHGLAAGRPGRNLDPVLVGPGRLPGLYAHGARGADLAVIEGVMGLYDGRIESGPDRPDVARGSTAEVAALLGVPVLLVVDARGQSQSVAALVRGFAVHDPATRVAGVILNRVGSPRHTEVLTQACESVGVPVVGAVPRAPDAAVHSRHLGLVTATEGAARARAAVAAMADLVARSVDLDAVVAAAREPAPAGPGRSWDAGDEVWSAPPVPATGRAGASERHRPVRVGIASGPAFGFRYAEHSELLVAAGAEPVEFDPVAGGGLPEDLHALVLPGGFPEEHADALEDATRMREAIAALVAGGAPVHAECGGLAYLCAELTPRPGERARRMVGALAGGVHFAPRLTLGYRDAVAMTASPVFGEGERVTGHEFHRTRVEPAAGVERWGAAWGWRAGSGPVIAEGMAGATLHASYLHTHPAGAPGSVVRLVAAARRHAELAGGPPVGGAVPAGDAATGG